MCTASSFRKSLPDRVDAKLAYNPGASKEAAMRIRLLTASAAVAVLVAAVTYAQAGRADDEAAIRRQIDQFAAAWNKADAKAVAQFFADDGDYVSSTGQKGEGRTGIEKVLSEQFAGVFKGATLKTTITAIRFLKPDVAIVNGAFEVSGMKGPDGKELPVRKGLSTNILAKQGDKWLIAALRGMVPATGPGRTTS
jgi:uncharacterized protein (TIGR02246 family)